MSATIIAFPAAADARNFEAFKIRDLRGNPAPIAASMLAHKFVDHFLLVVQASIDLLEADEHDFEARCRRMLDADGTAMIDELCAEMQIVGRQMQIVGRQMQILVDGLELTRGRLRTAMTRLAAPIESTRGNG